MPKCTKRMLGLIILWISFLAIPAAIQAQNDIPIPCGNVAYTTKMIPANCLDNGTIQFTATGSDLSYTSELQYRLVGYTTDAPTIEWTANPNIGGLPAGSYNTFMRGYCTKYTGPGQEERFIVQGANVTVTTTYTPVNMYVMTSEVRKTLNCLPPGKEGTGMIPLSFTAGKMPYTATIDSCPPAYTGQKVFERNTAGRFDIENLPAGTYKIIMKDDCSGSFTYRQVVGTVASDFPPVGNLTVASGSGVYTNPTGSSTDCKGLRISYSTSVPSTHELYPYFSNTSTMIQYYDFVLTENSNTAESPATSVTANYVYVSLMTLNYKDIYNSRYTGYPAGTGQAWLKLKVKGTSCTEPTGRRAIANTPYATSYSLKDATCTGVDYYSSQWTDYDGTICYPATLEVRDPNTNALVTSGVMTSSANQKVATIPYGTYKMEYIGADGGKWPIMSSGTSTSTYTFSKTSVYADAFNTTYCPADGKSSYIRVYGASVLTGNSSTFPNVFIAGTRIRCLSAPAGQALAPVVTVTGTTTSIVYPYSPTPTSQTYQQLLTGEYKFAVITPCGDSIVAPTVNVVAPVSTYNYGTSSTYTTTSATSYCKTTFNQFYSRFYTPETYFPGGTVITFKRGPDGTTNYPGVIHKNVTIPLGTTKYFNPFVQDYSASTTYAVAVPPGYYYFDVYNPACGDTKEVYCYVNTLYNSLENFGYTTKLNCNGMDIIPSGTMKYGAANATTYFRILAAYNPNGTAMSSADYPTTTVVQAGGAIPVYRAGSYVLQIAPDASLTSCFSDTVRVVYTAPDPKVNHILSSAYVCPGDAVGHIRVVAEGGYGSGPYSYHIVGTPTSSAVQGYTAYFNYGARGQEIKIDVTDMSPEVATLGCPRTFQSVMTMMDLREPHVAYEMNGGVLCQGDAIQLRCVTLGITTYEWIKLDPPAWGPVLDQFPVITNAQLSHTGLYQVSVSPEFCLDEHGAALIIKGTVPVEVLPTPPVPAIARTTASRCYDSGSYGLKDIFGINYSATDCINCRLKWYRREGTSPNYTYTVLSGENPSVATSSYATTVYCVSQVNGNGCEGIMSTPLTLNILTPPSAPNIEYPDPVCYGETAKIKLLSTTTGVKYYRYNSNTATAAPVDSIIGNGGSVIFSIPNITASSTVYYFAELGSNGCASRPRSSATIVTSTSGVAADITTTAGGNVCPATTATLTAELSSTSTVTDPVFYWYDGSTATSVLVGTGPSFTTPTLTANKTYYVAVSGYGVCQNTPATRKSVIASFTSCCPTPFSTGTVSGTDTICSGATTAIVIPNTAASGGNGTIAYRWKKSIDGATATIISGATTASYTIASGDADRTNTGSTNKVIVYTREAHDNACQTEFAEAAGSYTFVVRPPFNKGAITDVSSSICSGSTAAITISATAASGGKGITYQWKKSVNGAAATVISGATGVTYTIPTTDADRLNEGSPIANKSIVYTREVKDEICQTSAIASTGSYTLTVYHKFDAGNVTDSMKICSGSAAVVIVGGGSSVNIREASGGEGVITYSWKKSVNGAAAVEVGTSANYTLPPADPDRTNTGSTNKVIIYTREAHDNTCNKSFEAATGVYKLVVYPVFSAGDIKTTSESICSGATTAVTMGNASGAVSASGGNSSLTYQWKKSINGATATVISGATGATYTLPTTDADRTNTGTSNKVIVYTREAHDSSCQTSFVASSGTYTLTVRPVFSAGSISGSSSICSAATTTVTTTSVDAAGGDGAITYQWKKSIDGATATVISGATGATYTLPATDADRTNTGTSNKIIVYTREAHDGACQTSFAASTGTYTLTVRPVFNAGSISGSSFICSDATTAVETTSVAGAAGGNGTITYQWKKSINGATATVISGATGATYTLPTTDADRTNTGTSNKVIVYTREAHDGACQTSFAASTGDYTLTVYPRVATPTGDAAQSFCTGSTVANLIARLSGNDIKIYEAASGGTALATTAALETKTYYAVQIAGSCESYGRLAVAVTIVSVPSQPSTITGDNSVCQGEAGLIYSVTAVAGVTYTWSVPSDWTITNGQGTNSITVTTGTALGAGTVSVTPSNTVCGNGTARALPITLSICGELKANPHLRSTFK